MRNRMKYGMALVAIAAGLVAQNAKAVITNGTFETGDLTGYSTIGDVTPQGSDFLPPGGSNVGFLTTIATSANSYGAPAVSSAAGITSANSSAGLAAGTLAAANVKSVSLLQQTFFASAGDTITFNYNFLTNEAVGSTNQDFSFYTLKGPTGNATLVPLAAAAAATILPVPPSASNAGIYNFLNNGTGRMTGNLTSAALPITTSGLYTISFGVADVNDTLVDSGLVVDNLAGATGAASGVPLPAAVLPCPLGMAVAAKCSKRFRRQQA